MEFHQNDLSDLDDLTEEHLGFSALSEGLGFSKGKEKLPHPAALKTKVAPTLQAPLSGLSQRQLDDFDLDDETKSELGERTRQMSLSGAGAMAAGPARPAPAMMNYAPKTSITAPAPAKAQMIGPTPAAAAQVLAEPAAPQWLRASAFLLDALLIFVPLVLAWHFSFGSASIEIFLRNPRAPLSLFAMIFGAYFLLSESFGGQSLAKMLLGLRVVEDDKYQKPTGLSHAVVRLGLFLLSGLCLGLGFWASFWDTKRRPWHDRYSGSIVRRVV